MAKTKSGDGSYGFSRKVGCEQVVWWNGWGNSFISYKKKVIC